MEDVSDDVYLEKNAVKIAKEFQQIKNEEDIYGVYGDYRKKDHFISRRQTIHRITESQKKPQFTITQFMIWTRNSVSESIPSQPTSI